MGEFSCVGALAISSGGGNYKGSAVALSPEWVITAGHNVDLTDDGLPDTTWRGSFHLPDYGSFGVAQAFTYSGFTGFANPSVNDDLALLHLAVPLPCVRVSQHLAVVPALAILSPWSASDAPGMAVDSETRVGAPYTDWIYQTTGIPEMSGPVLWVFSALRIVWRRKK